jgi:uncharacterized membrane protein (UPF0127 family)
MRRLSLALAGVALAAACGNTPARPQDPFPSLAQAEVRAVTATGTHGFKVWIAADDASRARGLMFVRELAPDRGMLFVFEFPQEAAFWMKDTYLALDLVFIDAAGVVVNIAPDARPFSLMPIESDRPVIAVLEVPAGTARRIGLAPGDRIHLPSLPTTWTPPRAADRPSPARPAPQ